MPKSWRIIQSIRKEYQPSSRRLNENDKPLVYPADCEVKTVSSSGFLAHEGKSYHVGEPFAHKRVGLHLNTQGQTELYFANVHLGNLTTIPLPNKPHHPY